MYRVCYLLCSLVYRVCYLLSVFRVLNLSLEGIAFFFFFCPPPYYCFVPVFNSFLFRTNTSLFRVSTFDAKSQTQSCLSGSHNSISALRSFLFVGHTLMRHCEYACICSDTVVLSHFIGLRCSTASFVGVDILFYAVVCCNWCTLYTVCWGCVVPGSWHTLYTVCWVLCHICLFFPARVRSVQTRDSVIFFLHKIAAYFVGYHKAKRSLYFHQRRIYRN